MNPVKRIAHRAGPWLALLAMALPATPLVAQTTTPTTPGTASSERVGTDLPKRVVLRFVTESEYPPFNFYDDDGVLIGVNVDVARAICLELNATCDVKVRPWEELLPALARGEADAVIAGHTITPQTLAQVDFTNRYFHMPARFAGPRGTEEIEITPEGLDGKRIAVPAGTAHEAYLRVYFRDSRILPYASAELAREALLAGQADFLFDDGVSLVFWLNGALSQQCCEFKGGPFVEPRFFGDGMAIAVSKTDTALKAQLNQALRRVRASGRLEEIVARYFPLRVY